MKCSFTAVSTVDHPYVTECFDDRDCLWPGLEVEFLKVVMHMLRCSIRFIKAPDLDSQTEMLQNGSADITAGVEAITAETDLLYNYLPQYGFIDWKVFVTRKMTSAGRAHFQLLTIISPQMWLCIGMLSGSFYLRFPLRRKGNALVISKNISKFFKLAWFIWFGALISVYASILTLKIAVPKFEAIYEVNSVRDAIEALHSGSCAGVTSDVFADADLLLVAESLEAIGEQESL